MAERFKAEVLKTSEVSKPPWVRIPPSPPFWTLFETLPGVLLPAVRAKEKSLSSPSPAPRRRWLYQSTGPRSLCGLPALGRPSSPRIARVQVQVAKTGWPYIDRNSIDESLSALKYPLYFFDFEAISLPIPPYDCMRPFEFMPFQASIRIQEQDGWPISHFEYLGDGKADPRRELVDFLRQHIGPEGSVVVDNKTFKGICLKSLAFEFRTKYNFLLSVIERLWDIGEPFRGTLYVHPAFGGSYSLKTVVPALVPEVTYKNLAIQDGPEAQLAYWTLMTDAGLSDQERQKIMNDLRLHCGQDTLGMVALLKHLKSL